MITFEQFNQVLSASGDSSLQFQLPDTTLIPESFHVTEVGIVTGHFIDCGGVTRLDEHVQLQLWLGTDTAHRLNAGKLASVLASSRRVLQQMADYQSKAVMIEYETNQTSYYRISSMEKNSGTLRFGLSTTTTQCLATNRVQQSTAVKTDNLCCPPRSCC